MLQKHFDLNVLRDSAARFIDVCDMLSDFEDLASSKCLRVKQQWPLAAAGDPAADSDLSVLAAVAIQRAAQIGVGIELRRYRSIAADGRYELLYSADSYDRRRLELPELYRQECYAAARAGRDAPDPPAPAHRRNLTRCFRLRFVSSRMSSQSALTAVAVTVYGPPEFSATGRGGVSSPAPSPSPAPAPAPAFNPTPFY